MGFVRQRGFTLIELMAVLTIVSIVSIMVSREYQAKAVDTQVDAMGERAVQVSEAVKYFRQQTNDWPNSVSELIAGGYLEDHPDPNMPRYGDQFTLSDTSGNRLTVRFQTGDLRYARRLAGLLPYGSRSGTEVTYKVDRPGFEASIAAATERFYDLDGSRPLEGDMNADGHNISNVGRITANELRGRRESNPGYVRPDGNSFFSGHVDVGGTVSGYDLRAENRVYGRAFYDSDNSSFYLNPSSNSRVAGNIQVDGELRSDTLRSRTNTNYYVRPSARSFVNQLEVANDVTATSFKDRDNPDYYVDPSSSGRSAYLGGRLAARGIEFTGTGSVGGNCSSYGRGIAVTNSGSLLYCNSSNRWAAVGGQGSFTARGYSMIKSGDHPGTTGYAREWSFSGSQLGLREGTYAVQIQAICHVADPHNVQYNITTSAYGGQLRLMVARASGSGDDIRSMNTMIVPIDGRNGRITISKPAAAEPCDAHKGGFEVIMNGYFES